MPTRTVDLTAELNRFIDARVESGHYESPSEVVAAALHTLEDAEDGEEAKMAWLRAAIAEGDASGIAEGDGSDVIARIRAELNLPAPSR